MATIKSKYASGKVPMPIPSGVEVVAVKAAVALTAAEVVNGNVIQLAILPGDCVPVGYILKSDDLDTNGVPTITADLGILNAAGTAISILAADGGDEWIDGSTLPQAGGIALHTASAAAYNVLQAVTPDPEDRIVALVIASAVATAAAGTVQVELFYKSA